MPHGTVDWGMDTGETLYALVDNLSEIPPRLGHPSSIDRRGLVFFQDNFDSGVSKWKLTGSDDGETFVSAIDHPCTARFSGKLTTGAGAANWTRISKFFPFPQNMKVGFEISFTLDDSISSFRVGFDGYSPDGYERADIYHHVASEALYYYRPVSSYTEFATEIVLKKDEYVFHIAKIVIDLSANEHVRLILDDTEYSLADLSYHITSDLDDPYLAAYFQITTGINVAGVSYIDNAITTWDES